MPSAFQVDSCRAEHRRVRDQRELWFGVSERYVGLHNLDADSGGGSVHVVTSTPGCILLLKQSWHQPRAKPWYLLHCKYSSLWTDSKAKGISI